MRALFVSLTDDVGTDRVVAAVGRAGAACAVLSRPRSYAAMVGGVSARFALPRATLRATFALDGALHRTVRTWHPDRIVPLDDLSATLLRTLACSRRVSEPVRGVLRDSFGASSGYAAACERVALMEVAARSGVRVPAFAGADGRTAVQIGFPLVVKRDQSSGSGGVVRVDEPGALAGALRAARCKTAAKGALARLAGVGRPVTPALMQRVVEGRLAMFTAVCRAGDLIDGAGFLALRAHPVKRSSTVLQPCRLPEMEEAARRLVAALGCSGFVSLDFIVDAEDRAFLIELNPRPIGSTHLGRLFGHDLAHAFVTGHAAPPGRGEPPPEAVALFPKELERDPDGLLLGEGGLLHDVPADEPDVLAAYLRHLDREHPAHAGGFAAYAGGFAAYAEDRRLMADADPRPLAA